MLNEVPAGPARQELLNQLFDAWAKHSPADAAAAALQLTGAAREQVISGVAATWATRDAAAAFTWATSLPPNAMRDEVVQGVLRSYALKNPKAAAAWALTQQPTGNKFNEAVAIVASGLQAATNPSATPFARVQTLPEGSAKQDALRSVFSQESSKDPTAAADVLAALPQNQQNMYLYQQLASQWAQTERRQRDQVGQTTPVRISNRRSFKNIYRALGAVGCAGGGLFCADFTTGQTAGPDDIQHHLHLGGERS